MSAVLKKSTVVDAVAKGGKMQDIADRIGISINMLRKAAKEFNINLRKKPKEVVEFVDDTNTTNIEDTVFKKVTVLE